jgi:hypothetical protein
VTAANTHSVAAAVGSPFRYATLGAQIGAGVIWTFGPGELIIPAATTAGIVIITPSGTGQVVTFDFTWDE